MDFNPYAPPSAAAEGEAPATFGPHGFVLAEHGPRMLAKLIDAVTFAGSLAPSWIADEVYLYELADLLLVSIPSVVLIGQWALIGATGQSLGKRATGLRVITSKGARLGFFRGIFLREWVMKFGSGLLYGFPLLLDPLFAFTKTRQCLHDHLADTLVIVARSPGDPYA